MARIRRVLLDTDGWSPLESVTVTDQATGQVLGTGVADAGGAALIQVQAGIALSGAATGDAEASGGLTQGQVSAGAAGGAAGGQGTMRVDQPLSGAAGGQAGGAGTLSGTGGTAQPLSGGAAGAATGGAGTPTVSSGATPVSVSDNFNRANGALGSNWAAPSGVTAPTILNNNAYALTMERAAYWAADTVAADQYASGVLVGGGLGPAVRMASSGHTYYCANALYDTGADDGTFVVELVRYVGGAGTTLGSEHVGVAASSVLRVEAQGTTIRLKINGATIETVTDSTIASGQPGMAAPLSLGTLDTWSGGTL